MNKVENGPIEAKIEQLGEQIWANMKGELPGAFNKDFWVGRILEWAMQDRSFKIDLFRLVDVLPALKTSAQVRQHVQAYLLKPGRELPAGISATLKLSSSGLMGGLASFGIKKGVTDMAHRFIVGDDALPALPALRKLHKKGFPFTVDLLGEATLSDSESTVYQDRYMALIDTLADEVSKWKPNDLIDTNHLGTIPRANVSVKVTSLDPHIDPVDPVGSVARLKEKILPLMLRAKERGVFINLDIEQWEYRGITLDLFEALLEHPELRSWPHAGLAIQAYTTCAEDDLKRLLKFAKRRGTPITIRLVKGAYWDFEVVRARQLGHKIPVFQDKAESDLNYEKLSTFMLRNIDHILPAFASHNLRSLSHIIGEAEELNVPKGSYEIQMLNGMAEPERKAFRNMGIRVRVYSPVGELIPGMAYLVRRLLENTSNEGFLNLSHHNGKEIAALMAKPEVKDVETVPEPQKGLDAPFENCSFTDFADNKDRDYFAAAVEDVRSRLPLKVPVVVNGKTKSAGNERTHPCPSDTTLDVATVSLATIDDAEEAVQAAWEAYPEWRDTPIRERSTILDKLADIMEEDRNYLAALMVYEEGKPWHEADGDVLEAIDFCRYYARRALVELTDQNLGDKPGETNVLFYEGRGPTVIISPWNFPLAVLCGMSTGALAAGNPILIKPSGQACAIGHALYTRMRSAGFPEGVIHFLPGEGRVIGNHMIEHPLVAQIAFTGSKEVGLSILAKAMNTKPGQPQVKRMICEMGGKNAIIVDDDADLDEAVAGVVKSAYGYAGQKCSACSRVFVVAGVYESFVERLVEATKSLIIGPAHIAKCELGPVIDEASYKRLLGVIADLGGDVEILYKGEVPSGGYFVPPTIVRVDDINHKLMQEEQFGPILAIKKVADFNEAIDCAMSTEFALTGAVFSRNPSHLDIARKRFRVGNLYLNQGSTGAMVGRQAFGGFAMSGIGSKAGGPGYLLNFSDPRSVTENTMRRGFSPEVMV